MVIESSLDNLLDIRDALDKENVFYILIVGRQGESCTRAWLRHQGCLDENTLHHVHACIDKVFQEEREGHHRDHCG